MPESEQDVEEPLQVSVGFDVVEDESDEVVLDESDVEVEVEVREVEERVFVVENWSRTDFGTGTSQKA